MIMHTNVDSKSELCYDKHTKGTKYCDAGQGSMAKGRKQAKPTDVYGADSSIFCFKLVCVHWMACYQF